MGTNETYEIRIWWTNVTHIMVDVAILLMPIPWIRRSQPALLGRLVYSLFFLAGVLCVEETPIFMYLLLRVTCANVLSSRRTTTISIYRLTLLAKRFDASAERRYELSILAVMCSVAELHLSIIFALLPRLGYTAFVSWIQENKQRRVSGRARQERTIGNPGVRNYSGEGVPLNLLSRQYNDVPYHNGIFNNGQEGQPLYDDGANNDMASYHRPFQARIIE